VVPPMSKRPLTVYAPSRYQRTKRSRMSRTSTRPVARMLSQARERHGGVVAPGAGGLAVRAVPRHARALERAAGAELAWHAEGVAHGLSVDAAAKGGGGMLRGGHGTHFGGVERHSDDERATIAAGALMPFYGPTI
jgi:hypothetical protein